MKKEKKIKEKKIKENTVNEVKQTDNKEKKELVTSFSLYKFIVKIIACVLLITFAIVLFIKRDTAIFVLLLVSGGVTIFINLFRLVFLLKNEKCKEARYISLASSILELLIGLFLVLGAFIYLNKDENTEWFSNFIDKNYPYFIAGIFYINVVSYFWQTVLYKIKTTKVMFWLNIIFVSLSILLVGLANKIGANEIIITLAIIAIICALVIGGEAAGGYFNYRKAINSSKEKENERKIEDTDTIQTPAKDEEKIINEIDPSIIPVDDNDTDQSIVS